MVGSRSDGVVKCFRFAAPMILRLYLNAMILISKNPQSDVGFEVVEAQEVRCQLVTLDVQKVFMLKVQWKFRNMSCTFADLIGINTVSSPLDCGV